MASTERGDEQAPATASSAEQSPTFPSDPSGLTLEQQHAASAAGPSSAERENGHAPVSLTVGERENGHEPAPALPVRRARRVVLTDPPPPPPAPTEILPAASALNGNGAGADTLPDSPPTVEWSLADPGAADYILPQDSAVPSAQAPAPDEPPPAPDEPQQAAPVALAEAPLAADAVEPPPASNGHLDEAQSASLADLPAAPARPAVTAWVPSALPVRGRRGADGRATPLIQGVAAPPIPGAPPTETPGPLLGTISTAPPAEALISTASAAGPVAQAIPVAAPVAPARRRFALPRLAPRNAPPRALQPDPDAILEAEADTAAVAATGWRAAVGRSALWRSRALIVGGLGVGFALYGQQQVTVSHSIIPGIRWYALAIVLMILSWLGTYKNKSFLLSPFRRLATATNTLPVRTPARKEPPAPQRKRRFAPWRTFATKHPALALTLRYILAGAALALNLYSVTQLRSHGYDSVIGGWGWAASLILLLIAALGYTPPAHRSGDALVDDVEDRTDVRIDRRLEIVIFLAIFALGFFLRFYRLDDWTTGMHGDEGEAGMDALGILEGQPVSPFLSGWFSQPNFYYWGIALTMKVFGTGLGGLRTFSALGGTLMLIPFYPMVRQWFGVRTAIIATFLLAVSDVAIHFSKQEFSNITTPLFLVTGFYFFFRGLRDRKLINFVLAGYAHILSMYFYLGGRLTPILVIAFMVYLFLLMPLLRLPGVYGQLRKRLPEVGRLRALGRAFRFQVRGVWLYANQIILYTLACICFITPWGAYFLDHQQEWNSRANDKLILNNPDRMVQQHGATHTPLYIGLRPPTANDILPLPIVFEQTPLSIRLLPLPWVDPDHPSPTTSPLLQDGFWARAMWGQLTTTLSILTYRGDASSVYTFTAEPVAKPIEAVLIILGIAWAAWRWRDTRMALLSLWFWSTVIVGGVLTIDAPYMARLVGIIPTLAIFAAIPLNKLVAEFINVIGRFGRSLALTRTSLAFSSIAVFSLLIFLGRQNYTDYFDRYLQQVPAPFTEVTGQAVFVRDMNAQLAAEGRPLAKFYDLGAHLIYWGHGDNRFLNHGVEGLDMVNASNELPVLENGPHNESDAVFMVWGLNQQYLSVLRAYYPDGIEQPYYYPNAQHGSLLFTSFRVPKEQLDAQRVLMATYTPAHGPVIQRQEPTLGTGSPPLDDDVAFPVQAQWTGNLVAPAFGRYRFHIDGPSDARLVIDGTPVITGTTGAGPAEGTLILARGPHDITLSSTLAARDTPLRVQWAIGNQIMGPIPRAYLWSGPGRGLLGDVRPLVGDAFGAWPADNTGNGATPTILRRVDGFLGFRDAPSALSNGGSLMARWTGTLTAEQGGSYQFSIFSNGDSTLAIDGQMVVDNRQGPTTAHQGDGAVTLTPGAHQIEVRYAWLGNVGYLETYWTPPNGQRAMLGPADLHADGGAWAPGTVAEPGNVNVQLGVAPPVVPADAILDARDNLQQPRGLALDAQGNLYIADSGNHRVIVLDKTGHLVRTWVKEGTGPGAFATPEDIGIGADGLVYVLDSTLNSVQVFTPDGTFKQAIGVGALTTSAGMTIGPDGNIYVADVTSSRIREFTPAGAETKDFTAGTDAASQLSQPVDVAVGKDGALYVADLRNRIVKIDATTDTISKTWPVPIGTNLGAANMTLFGKLLYVTDPDRNHIDVLNVETGQLDQYAQGGTDSGQFGEPLGIATDATGALYVVDSDHGRIEVFNRLVPSQ